MAGTASSATRRLRLALITAATLLGVAAPQVHSGESSWCGERGGLALLGVDTASGRLLMAPPSPSPFLVEIDLESRRARRVSGPAEGGYFAGSAGPGPILALRRCGETCVQAYRWSGVRFLPVGARLEVAATANLFTTYDRTGTPWLVTHRPSTGRWIDAAAFRLEGGAWRPRGRLLVQGVLAWGALPAPGHADAVISGTGLFAAKESPATWIQGFPTLPAGKEGEVAPLGASGAAYFAADGAVYSSPDAGATWQGSRFRPWGREPSEIWTFGSDYTLDLPIGSLGEPLPLAWFDRRGDRRGKIYLTELAAAGGWRVSGEVPAEIEVSGGEAVELVHLLHKDGGTWLLLSDCFEHQGRPTIALVVSTLAGPEAPVYLTVP